MSSVPHDVMCFDIESGLSKALGKKVETFFVDVKAGRFKFRIGLRWNLVLDTEQLEDLWDDAEAPTALRDKFNGLKAECLGFQDYKRS